MRNIRASNPSSVMLGHNIKKAENSVAEDAVVEADVALASTPMDIAISSTKVIRNPLVPLSLTTIRPQTPISSTRSQAEDTTDVQSSSAEVVAAMSTVVDAVVMRTEEEEVARREVAVDVEVSTAELVAAVMKTSRSPVGNKQLHLTKKKFLIQMRKSSSWMRSKWLLLSAKRIM